MIVKYLYRMICVGSDWNHVSLILADAASILFVGFERARVIYIPHI